MNRRLASDEVELIDPQTPGEVFDLLRSFHSAEWTDARGHWHVIVTRAALDIILAAIERELAKRPRLQMD